MDKAIMVVTQNNESVKHNLDMAKKNKRAESRARYFTRKTAADKGWNTAHPSRGGDFLEEQEIAGYFPEIGLGLNRPDFMLCLNGEPAVIIETKNELNKYKSAVSEAVEYCEMINRHNKFNVKIAIGVAGEDENGYIVVVKYLKNGIWEDLSSHGNAITAILSKDECINALASDDATTEVRIPTTGEFVDAAIEVSNILRTAKIETTLRPKVVGAVTTALYHGDIDIYTKDVLADINNMMSASISGSRHFNELKKQKLIEALTLGINDFGRLAPYIFRIISILKRLNVRAVLQSDADFLGMFYEAFLRYGADNNAMGIVFTPRHITKMCVNLVGVEIGQKIIDITCGTGGFLVSAFDSLKQECRNDEARSLIRESIFGFDTNPTVWALSCLNMFFRGDGKSNIENTSSLVEESRESIRNKFNRAFLNPPFHQDGEPERDFIDASMDSLIQGGLFVGVVYAGVFADDENKAWRDNFMRKHTIVGMISLPDELFYPNASAITTIMIARAKVPQPEGSEVFMARIYNDGFEKLKGKRVECRGNQIPVILREFRKFMKGERVTESDDVITVKADLLKGGAEYSPQQYIPHKKLSQDDVHRLNKKTLMSLFQTIAGYPDITESMDADFYQFNKNKRFPLNKTDNLERFFDVKTGKSKGLKSYTEGIVPYVSSGDGTNGVVGLVTENGMELCNGCITVSAFGTAYLQPWSYMARGNGGSSVRVLIPKYRMTVKELFWFIAQINSQKWRFTYARQAIKSRLVKLKLTSPSDYIDDDFDLIRKLTDFKTKLSELSEI